MLTTTKRKLVGWGACEDRYNFLCTWAPECDDAEITLLDILDNNGPEDAIWALCACDGHEEVSRYLARWCASQVLHLWDAPAVVRDYLRTGDEKLRATAAAAAWDAASAAWDAARVAARAAGAAASDAARVGARVAASAAWDAAWYAAADAALAAAGEQLRSLLIDGAPSDGIVEVGQKQLEGE